MEPLQAALFARRQGLPDRRGERRIRADARRRRSLRTVWNFVRGDRGCGGRRSAIVGERTCGAAFASLRVVRSVREFRGARRRLPGMRRQMARAARASGRARATRGDRAHGFKSGTRPRRRLDAHRGSVADRVVHRAHGDRPRDGAGGKPGGRRAAEPFDFPLRQPPGSDADPDGGLDDRHLVSLAAACAPRGAGDIRGVVCAHHSRAHVRRGGERREAVDLRPPAIGVHQAGVRRSRRLGVHGRGPDGPDRDLGETSVLPAFAAHHRAAHPRARLRPDDAGRGRLDGALFPGRPALVLGGRGRRNGHGRRVRRVQTVAARA